MGVNPFIAHLCGKSAQKGAFAAPFDLICYVLSRPARAATKRSASVSSL